MTTDLRFNRRIWPQRRPYFLLVGISLALLAFVGTGRNVAAAPLQPSPPREAETFICMDVTEIPYSECVALYTLYNETNGPSWINHTDWGTTTTPCSWYGVTCQDGQVTRLDLSNNGLNGTIPSVIAELPALQKLMLPYNQLHGTIPSQLGNLQDLQLLHLVSNQLSGAIPTSFGNLTELYQLSLDANQLSGPIPAALGNLPRLRELRLTYNQLSGEIPAALGNITTLQGLMLAHNRLEGAIPAELRNLSNLLLVDLSSNQLRGDIPPNLIFWNILDYLKLDYNELTANDKNLTDWLGRLTPTWNETQTVPPTDIYVEGVRDGQLTVSWTPIPYTANNGYYEISLATQEAGPFATIVTTADKTERTYTFTNLTAADYYVRVRTHTAAHGNNQNALWSDYSSTVRNIRSFRCTDVTEIPNSECEALVALYNSTEGPHWLEQSDWLQNNTPCSWYGVTCEAGHISELNLCCNHLHGTIPSLIGNLSHLQKLNLRMNGYYYDKYVHVDGITGTIPSEIGNLIQLRELNIADNALSGPLPTELSHLINLQVLDLNTNDLTGPVLPELADLTELQTLHLGSNQLNGTIPEILGNLNKLQMLDLSNNELTGNIPSSLSQLTNLTRLELRTNNLTGPIPAALGQLTNLEELSLWWNQLTGEIPPELGNLVNLDVLALSRNQLTGSIPPALANLTKVRLLYLDENRLHGSIPPQLGNMASLESLGLSANQLRGEIPSTLVQLGTVRRYLYINYNALTATDLKTLSWLASTAYRWEYSQTVPPTNLAVHQAQVDTVTISWTPILFRDESGYYEISYATQSGGPFTVHGTTTDKTAASYTLTGLTSGNTSYIRVRTFTPAHMSNQNDIWSDYSEIVSTESTQPFSCASVTEIPQSECEALVTFYNSTDGPNWSIQNDWLTSSTPCSWNGLTCESSHVTVLKFDNSGPKGELPPQLEQLTYLRELYIDADVGGILPVELGNLSHLEKLILPWNQLTGPIPPELGKLQNLKELVLVDNNLSGPIPPELGNLRNLEELHIHVNQFSGGIPHSLANLVNLRALNLGLNQLTGAIPPELGNLTNLQYLTLEVNQLEGNIPASLGNLQNLKALALQLNQFRGEVPPEFAQLTGIEQFNVDYNALTATSPTLLAWLDIHASEWAKTQTVAPTNVMLGTVVDGDLAVTWTPIQYTENSGFYEISYGTSPTGPFLVHGVTVDKTVHSYTITGLSSDTTYYIRIRTKTAQPSYFGMIYDLWSDYSEVVEIHGTTATTLLRNGSFETGTEPWIFYTNGEGSFTTAGPAYAGDTAARIEIIKKGNNTQLYQTGFTLKPNTRYRLTFAAYSSSGHDLSLYLHQHTQPYTNYGLRNFRLNLTKGWQQFTVEFKTKNFLLPADTSVLPTDDTRLRLWLKPYAADGDIYWLDAISLETINENNTPARADNTIIGTVNGTVQLSTGANQPVALTLVDLESEGATFTRTTTTTADGTYHFSDIPAGNYELRATPPTGTVEAEPYQFLISERPNEPMNFVLEGAVSTSYLPLIMR